MMQDKFQDGGPSKLVDNVADWLMSQALGDGEIQAIFQGCCRRLVAAGLPLSRALITFRTLHPLYASVSLVWRRAEDEVSVEEMVHERAFTNEQFYRSPMFHMLKTQIPYLRRRLTGPEAVLDFPVLEELHDAGGTDYLGYLVAFAVDDDPGPHEDGVAGSWTTDRPAGFSDRDLRDLARVQRRLAVACKVQLKREIAQNVLTTYLGADAGRQVLQGQIKRGDGRRIYAAIWYSDLRDSTTLADTLAPEAYLELLNSYFECTAGAVLARGGEVLRFIGDAVLAIFPIADGADAAACAACPALSAMAEARERLEQVNAARTATGLQPIAFGLGLHVGEVMFGNIGVPERLEFSVIGPAANEVARLEELTKRLGRVVLVSGAFAALLPLGWEALGVHRVPGVGEPMTVHAPPADLVVADLPLAVAVPTT
jgi:adenylate cyclase